MPKKLHIFLIISFIMIIWIVIQSNGVYKKEHTAAVVASEEPVVYSESIHKVVVFNPTGWLNLDMVNDFVSTQCAYKNCILSLNRTNLQDQAAIIFILIGSELSEFPAFLPSERRPDQVWIYLWVEAHRKMRWPNAANWTMSYRQDADINLPYGRLIKRTPPFRNYSAIFRMKSKMVAWAVSHCITPSNRRLYVQELRSHGVSVDIYGKCTAGKKNEGELKRMINTTYMFYLGFENSLCKDYVTEKLFKYFQLDVIVVVRGGANYSSILPKNTYINTADFISAKELAEYLLILASNEKRYTDFLRNKNNFWSEIAPGARNQSFCILCEKLNNLDGNRKSYTDIYWTNYSASCTAPNDILNTSSGISVFRTG